MDAKVVGAVDRRNDSELNRLRGPEKNTKILGLTTFSTQSIPTMYFRKWTTSMKRVLFAVARIIILVGLLKPSVIYAKSWNNLGSGMNSEVYALECDASGNLYAGGTFTNAGGIAANNIARWDGTNWTNLGSGMSSSLYVIDLKSDCNGNVYAGGVFTTAGGVVANGIAKWNGVSWTNLGSGVDIGGVRVLACDTNGNIYAGGDFFTTAGGVAADHIAKWNGVSWSNLGSGLDEGVDALAIDTNGNLYAGGIFSWSGGTYVSHIAMWNGTTWSSIGSGLNNNVGALAFDASGNLYAGGHFLGAGSVAVNNIAKWNGSTWSKLDSGMNDAVHALICDTNNNLYAGGSFTTAGGVTVNRVACWNGATWTNLDSGINNDVWALTIDAGGNLYASGTFTNAGGVTVSRVARWGREGAIGIVPPNLNYTATYGGANPSAQVLVITNRGIIDFNYTNTVSYSSGATGWFSLSPEADYVEVGRAHSHTGTVSIAGLNTGIYYVTGTVISAEADNSPQHFVATLTVNDPPLITRDPRSLTNNPGQSATFSVQAIGTVPLSYQWQKWGTNLAGATSTNYTIASVAETNEGNYRCIVTNMVGSVTSLVASLMVNDPPSLGEATAINIMAYTAYLGGSVTATNGFTVTERGIYWSTNVGMVLAEGAKYYEGGTFDMGAFSFFVTNLPSGRTNYFLAYAAGEPGSNFTMESSFLTRPEAPVILPPTNITANTLYANWLSAESSTNYWFDVAITNDFGEYLAGYSNRASGLVLTCLVTGLETRVVYYYRVRSENATGVSTDSAVMTVSAGMIGLLPTSLNYGSIYGGTNPAVQCFVITNSGYWDFNFTNSAAYSSNTSGWWLATPATGGLSGVSSLTMTGNVTATDLNAGTYYVTNTVISFEATNSPQNLVVILTVSKANQTITNFIPSNGSLFETTNTAQLFAQASSGLEVTNFTVISGPAVISGFTSLTFSNSGVVKIKAEQVGDANWNAALAVTNTFNVGLATAVVTLTNLNQTYDGTPRVVGATTLPSGLSVTITYNESGLAPTAAGSYTVMGVVNSSIYQGGANGTLTVNKASQSITFPTIPDQMTTSRVALVATASSGLAVSFRVDNGLGTISGDELTFIGTGIVRVVASQGGNTNWNAAVNVANSFNVAAVSVTNLGIPQNVAATDGTLTGRVFVTWSAVAGADGYEIWNSDVNNIGTASTLGRSTTITYNDTSSGARSGLMKYYWLKAWNMAATGAFSAVDSGYALPEAGAEVISGQPAIGDYDGDGLADPAVYHLNSGRLYAWVSSAHYSLLEPAITFHVDSGEIPAFGDYDGDGSIDPGVFNALSGAWYIWLSSASYTRIGPILFGIDANDIPVAADYDGDCKTDPAIYRGAESVWYIWLSSGEYTRLGPLTQFHVGATDIPVPADYDGDDRADPAVYQATSGSWYIWLSSADYYLIGPLTYLTSDEHLAVPADYDGDELCDLAVYVPSLGKWRMWLSGSDYALTEMELR